MEYFVNFEELHLFAELNKIHIVYKIKLTGTVGAALGANCTTFLQMDAIIALVHGLLSVEF